jgi:hypothetical protein
MSCLIQLFSFRFFPIRRILLQFLTPREIAMILHILEMPATESEQSRLFLDDIFQDTAILSIAKHYNVDIFLFGQSLPMLRDYFRNPERYMQMDNTNIPPLLVVFRGKDAKYFPTNPLILELPIDRPSTNDHEMSKWMRVEPLCSRHHSKCSALLNLGYGRSEDATLSWQHAFWWDPSSGTTPACFKFQYRYEQPAKILTYITFSFFLDIRSVNISPELLKYALDFDSHSYHLHTAIVSCGETVRFQSINGTIPEVNTRLDNYVELYDVGLVLSFPIRQEYRLDILLPHGVISFS